jgi:4-hydroxythreonine-4-phosphate dehydrogenase
MVSPALPTVYITMGDPHGIGPEVVLKALHALLPQHLAVFGLCGSGPVLEHYLQLLQLDIPVEEGPPQSDPGKIYFLEQTPPGMPSFEPGRVHRMCGKASIAFLELALERIGKKRRTALVTGPVSKEAIWRAGYLVPGQTEFLAEWYGVARYSMMLISGTFRVGFVTTHHPLKEVAGLLSKELIISRVSTVREDLRRRFRIRKPKIAVSALNPHAGEMGMLGREEMEIIWPAVEELRQRGMDVSGPFSADTLFTTKRLSEFDAFMAMYHDQGMIPIKMHGFGKAVNYTAGLPIVRTSPDHGTAFDIAGKGVADATSMVEAIRLAVSLVH